MAFALEIAISIPTHDRLDTQTDLYWPYMRLFGRLCLCLCVSGPPTLEKILLSVYYYNINFSIIFQATSHDQWNSNPTNRNTGPTTPSPGTGTRGGGQRLARPSLRCVQIRDTTVVVLLVWQSREAIARCYIGRGWLFVSIHWCFIF